MASKFQVVDDFVAPRCDELVTILYQDDDILLIDKPSGLLSLSGKNPLNWDSVHYRLVHGQGGKTPPFPTAKLPHRLDFGTSGIMVVSLNEHASTHLNKQFQARTVNKRYLAVLYGWVLEDTGQIEASIAKDKINFPKVKICDATGKPAVSEFTVLERYEDPKRTLVEYRPVTGRTHQLRLHSLTMGHPILGCDLYNNTGSEILATRLMLHARDLYFKHPRDDKPILGHSPSPF